MVFVAHAHSLALTNHSACLDIHTTHSTCQPAHVWQHTPRSMNPSHCMPYPPYCTNLCFRSALADCLLHTWSLLGDEQFWSTNVLPSTGEIFSPRTRMLDLMPGDQDLLRLLMRQLVRLQQLESGVILSAGRARDGVPGAGPPAAAGSHSSHRPSTAGRALHSQPSTGALHSQPARHERGDPDLVHPLWGSPADLRSSLRSSITWLVCCLKARACKELDESSGASRGWAEGRGGHAVAAVAGTVLCCAVHP